MTASFCQELIGRAMLLAAVVGEEPGNRHLKQSRLTRMEAQEELSRTLLSGGSSEADVEWA